MTLFGITKTGFLSLSLAVGALWTCIGMERTITRRAERDRDASLQTLRRLRHSRGSAILL